MNSFFARIRYGSYKKSKHVELYENLAKEYEVTPQHVYEIAHGKSKHGSVDDKIFLDLVRRGIISFR